MNVTDAKACISALSSLGFTELEAAVYASLVQASPATGYRVAQAINKPVANTYKAIESLQEKGAVITDETGNKLCRAVPPQEVLQQLESTFSRQKREAADALSRLRPAPGDDGVYALTSRSQVFERCRAMLSRAEEIALVDVFPEPCREVGVDIEAAAARGVTVTAQVYERSELAGVETVWSPHAETVTKRWPGHWLNLVIDGSEFLMSFLADDEAGVHQAIWSRSPFLCWAYQSALAGEILSARMQLALEADVPASDLRAVVERFGHFRAHESLGYRALAKRLGVSTKATR